MYKAITTVYLPATNQRGARYKAIGNRRTRTQPEYSLVDPAHPESTSHEEEHCRVAKLFAVFAKWSGLYVAGTAEGATVWVNLGNDPYGEFRKLTRYHGTEGRNWFYVAP